METCKKCREPHYGLATVMRYECQNEKPQPKPNPFLAGMRATGRRAGMTDEDRREYEAGYTAINEMVDELYTIDAFIGQRSDSVLESIKQSIANVETTWSRIKAALAGEVTP